MHEYHTRTADLELRRPSNGDLLKLGDFKQLPKQLWDFRRGEDAVFLCLIDIDAVGRAVY